jgi:hypothetical protein
MTYDQLLDLLLSSGHEDWLVDEAKGILTLKNDLDVTIREIRTDHEDGGEPFDEPWATQFPNPDAERQTFELWYRASFVKTYNFVAVDGGRASLPYPKSMTDLTITREQFAVAEAVNTPGFGSYFDNYIQRFKIEN